MTLFKQNEKLVSLQRKVTGLKGIPNAGTKHLLVRSLVRQELQPYKVSQGFVESLENHVKELLNAAKQRCQRNKRQTVMRHDL